MAWLKTDILNKDSIFEALRFIIVGLMATFTDLVISTVLFYFTDLGENAITTFAFAIAFFVSYFGHKNYTFRRDGRILAFFALAFSMLLLRNIIVFVLVSFVVKGLPALITAMVIVTVATYLISKFLVFK